MPIELIEGKVTSGSINIDGASAIRRTCSLSLIAKDLNINDIYWGIQNKFKLEVGIKNFIDSDYPEIVWFSQGIYVITGFNTTQNLNSYTVSISGKDKMCLLNGDIGGNLAASVDFGVEEYWDRENNIVTYTKIPIKTIIREMIHTYALEPYHNIIINDLEDCGFELLEYRGDKPLYLWYDINSNEYINAWLDGSKKCWSIAKEDEESDPEYTLDTIPFYDNRIKINDEIKIEPTEVYFNQTSKKLYTISKVEYGQTIGYRMTDLVYAGDLISNIGESLTSILDKIKNMLGNFEYFYDLDGRFIFQKKKIYVDTPKNGIVTTSNDETYVENSIYATPISYQFDDGNLISSYQNTPNLNNLKNDYAVWGTRKGVSGADIPIHYRYALDKKPVFYQSLDGKIYTTITDDSIKEQFKQQKKQEIYYQIKEELKAFKLKYEIPSYLEAPTQKDNGEWSNGWWDIRDFHDYYKLLTGTSPIGTMKWYSQHDLSGCTSLYGMPGYHSSNYIDYYVWLIIVSPNGRINTQHGSGSFIPAEEKSYFNTYYESYLDEEGKVVTLPVSPSVTKKFASPFSGCNDQHTYLSFLKEDIEKDGNAVYFYNPNFPFNESFEKMVEEKIDIVYEDFILNGGINIVDWREIIYQMAKDFYKHNQDDDFLIKVANNNKDYYPTGITGYEQYYIDIEGFWRQIYDPEETGIYTEYNYITSDGEEEFVMPLDDEGLEPKVCTNLIVTERAPDYEKKADLFSIITLNGENEVQKVIDIIPVVYNFNEKGEQIADDQGLLFYTTKDNSVTKSLKDRLVANNGKVTKEDYQLIVELNWGLENQFTLQENGIYSYSGDDFTSFIQQVEDKVIQDGFVLLNKNASLRVEKKELYYFVDNRYISLLDYYLANNTFDTLFTIDFAESSKDCVLLEELFEPIKNIIYNAETGAYKKYLKSSKLFIDATLNLGLPAQKRYITYYTKTFEFFRDGDYKSWNKIISTYPDQLNFWFDFLDSGDYDVKKNFSTRELDSYAVNVIGSRPKVVNNSQVTSIYFREVPNLIYLENGNVSADEKAALGGYQFIQNIPINLFSISAQGKSAYEELQSLLYNHSYCIESITISAIPIYYLQPNTRISVHDKLSEIYGEYIISKITIPLTYNGMMSITATKAPVRLL